MTTARDRAGHPGTPRGRGLDALFEGITAPASVGPDVDADLAALLDDEVLAAETGRSPVSAAQSGVPSGVPPLSHAYSERARWPEFGDALPPASGAKQISPPATPSPEPARQFPATRRFGAIIIDEALGRPVSARNVSPAAQGPMVPEERWLPPGPGVAPEVSTPLPALVERTDDQKKVVISRLDRVLEKDWQRAFHQQIDALYRQVATEFSSPPAAAERALTLLREARQLMIDSPEEYVGAEYHMMQVRAMLDRIKESRAQSARYGPRILAYQVGWLLLLLLGLIFATPLTRWITIIGGIGGPALLSINPILNTMSWGGIGGVVGALYALWWHISEKQDFDRHYMTWYLVQPLMGLALGGITFLILTGGFLILQVDLSGDRASTGALVLPYLAAVLAGFRQNFVYGQLERFMGLFTPATRKKDGGGEGPGL